MGLAITNNIHDPIVKKMKTSFKSISAPISSAITNTLSLWEDSSIEMELNILETLFTFKDYSEVSNFLKENKFIIPLLFEAYGEICSLFGANIDILLEVKQDNEFSKLYVLIVSSNTDAYDLLDELDENWWIDAVPKANHKLNIDLEY